MLMGSWNLQATFIITNHIATTETEKGFYGASIAAFPFSTVANRDFFRLLIFVYCHFSTHAECVSTCDLNLPLALYQFRSDDCKCILHLSSNESLQWTKHFSRFVISVPGALRTVNGSAFHAYLLLLNENIKTCKNVYLLSQVLLGNFCSSFSHFEFDVSHGKNISEILSVNLKSIRSHAGLNKMYKLS